MYFIFACSHASDGGLIPLYYWKGVKLKEAGQTAGTFVGDVAKDTKENVADVAGKVGSAVKSRWEILQHPSTKHEMQEKLISAAATTSMFLRKGFSGTKDKVAMGKTKVEEVIELEYLMVLDIIQDLFP